MKSQKILGLFLVFIFSATSILAEDLSCPPEEPSKVEALISGIHARLKAGTFSKEFCHELMACKGYGAVTNAECVADEFYDKHSGTAKHGNCNMDLQERRILSEYMGSLYSCMNRALYSDQATAYPTLNQSLNSALSRFPVYEGFVFRGSNLPQPVLDKHQVGTTVTYPAFTSSSTKRDVADNFGLHQFLIFSQTGRTIMGRKGGGGEHEVLFTAGTRFRVLAAKGKYFFLREVTGQETEAQAKAEDLRILNLAREAKKNFKSSYSETPDSWSCPLDDKKIPSRLVQKTIPDLSEFVD